MDKLELNEGQQITVARLMEGGLIEDILSILKQNISLDIIGTDPSEDLKRESLYYKARAIDDLKGLLQSCVNNTYTMEN